MTALYDILLLAVVLSVAIGAHELGHLLVARALGIHASVFSIGFGLKGLRPLLSRTDGRGTEWRLSAIPFGGYVALPGLPAATPARRAAVLAAGPAASLLLCVALYVLASTAIGLPGTAPVITRVEPGAPAERAGLRVGDAIRRVDGDATPTSWDVRDHVVMAGDRPLDLVVERGGREVRLTVTPASREVESPTGAVRVGHLGLDFEGSASVMVRLGPVAALRAAGSDIAFGLRETAGVFAKLVSDPLGAGALSGPIGVATVMAPAAARGLGHFVHLVGTLSLSVGIFNMLPVPGLDGGGIVIALVEAVRGRRLSERVEGAVLRGGLAAVLLLAVLTTAREAVGLAGYALGR